VKVRSKAHRSEKAWRRRSP
jgi:hypothetical protein